ncbi:MAG: NnrS family protein [Bradyrhizobium sp.]|uniref:NnrS family protein n=1 Tax=Bradyrhizobium sp. TaxID=376 RepID=UPI00120950B6|nr:NnrS family protein [Bradyrhizobium sp.]THD65125.1 MAG: NnrS family protein [Bradyrhizobium sp.]
MIPIPRLRLRDRWTLLSSGFRPFFLLGSIYAGLAILIWLPVFTGELDLTTTFTPCDWHVHEMLYGYLPAVITGFLFTAIPNWTGRLPIRGTPLLGLVVLWLAGRVCVTFSAETGWLAAMLVDASFLLLVAAAAAREIIAGRKWNNLNVVVLVLLLLAGNIAFHLEAHFHGAADISIRIGIAIVVMLISLIGGRIIPSFTRNWLARENPGRLPAPFGRFDMMVVATSALVLLFWVVWPNGAATAVALGLIGCLHLVRLGRWAGGRTWRERLVLILHIGYAFVPIGFLLNAASAFGLVPASAGIHAWMAGAAGVMTLAVMTRATLGHTGQKLTASASTQAIYAAAIVAVVARICAVIEPVYGVPLLHLAAFAWAAAFVGFAISFGPVLISYEKGRPNKQEAAA